jgi:hypothetical protein
MTGGAVLVAGSAAALAALAVTGGLGNAGTATGAGFMAMMGIGMFATGALRVSGWARRRKKQIDDIIARLAVSAD